MDRAGQVKGENRSGSPCSGLSLSHLMGLTETSELYKFENSSVLTTINLSRSAHSNTCLFSTLLVASGNICDFTD